MDEQTRSNLLAGLTVQFANYRAALAEGMPRAGWKVAINDPVAQGRLGIDSPLTGYLDGRALHRGGATLAVPPGKAYRIEVEVALRLQDAVAASASLQAAGQAIAAIAPALEVVDATSMPAGLQAFAESNFIHVATVLGQELPYTGSFDELPALNIDDLHDRAGIPGRVPADLGEIVLLVARWLEHFDERLQAGDRIICGSFIDPAPIVPGSTLAGVFPSLGTVELQVSA